KNNRIAKPGAVEDNEVDGPSRPHGASDLPPISNHRHPCPDPRWSITHSLDGEVNNYQTIDAIADGTVIRSL
ncbi:hypothetical protein HAX54_042260, partial [Datura stramonium]|nr:hypothetical protein [Datura stramonium]